MKCTSFLVACATLSASSAARDAYWSPADGGNGHLYRAIPARDGIIWEDARDLAQARGGYLATLTSAAENDFVFDQLASNASLWTLGTYGPWLGGFQTPGMRDPSEGWSWVTGESWSFTAWGVGEPNDALGAADETFLHFDNVLDTPIPGRMWNDYQNAGGTPVTAFIVEFNTPAPGPLLISTILIGGSVFCRRHQRRE